MSRPIWKGSISFGLVNIPITLFSAEKRSDLHFQMIDSRNHARVRYQRVNEATGEEVPWGEIVKGFSFDDGDYVLLSEEDFQQAARETSRTIEIEDFVEADAIDRVYFDKPYYLVPGKGGEKGYVLLREALKESGKVGIARVVIRTREYLSAVLPEGDALILDLMRYQQELRDTGEFSFPRGELSEYKVSKKELDLAKTLVESMSSDWEPHKYRDEYRDALMEYIETKISEGRTAASPPAGKAAEPEKAGKVIDMMDLLKKSVADQGAREGPRSGGRKSTATKKTGSKGSGKKKAKK